MQLRLIMFLYRLLAAAVLPFAVAYLLRRLLRDRRYCRGLSERMGWLPAAFRQTAPGSIWLHAVSVGEVLSAVELISRLRDRLPYAPLFVSVTTVAGRELAEKKLAGLADAIFHAPVDYCFAVRRVLRALRPRAVIVLETEIWPNLWRESRRAGCALLVVNGRISDRALPRYRRLRWFFQPLLALPDTILVQDDASYRRYLELGAPPDRTRVAGNLKFDFDPGKLSAPAEIEAFLRRLKPSAIWIAASTMPPAEPGDPDEDEAVIAAFQQLASSHRGLLLILAPRRPERFEQAAQRLLDASVPFVRRSRITAGETLALPGVLLLDSIGELASLFQLADVVFMGGTLAHRGGHNVLEPGAFARAIITGPHLENFPAVAEEFRRRRALFEIGSAAELAPAVARLLADEDLRRSLGGRALEASRAQQGAVERAASEIVVRYSEAIPQRVRAWPWRAGLWLLARLWLAGGAIRRICQNARRTKLAAPVVSVGALAMGGTGKTPFTLWLARELKSRGFRPAVLLRGYRRVGGEPLALAPGTPASPEATGDEAQLHLRAGAAAVGVGADRARVGRMLWKQFRPDLFVLDDGFQHARLARDLDIVLVDALDPGDEVFPLGRLRERPAALARAACIVINHAEALPHTQVIERLIRRHNPHAAVFRARLRAQAWVEARSGTRYPVSKPPFRRPAAFCGLGQPASFWRALRVLGAQPLWRREYPDHHRYRSSELRALATEARASGADALLTTEKDLMNFPHGWEGFIGELPLYWLEVALEVEEAAKLLRMVLALIPART